jgi:hypothetical protein
MSETIHLVKDSHLPVPSRVSEKGFSKSESALFGVLQQREEERPFYSTAKYSAG